MDSTYSPHSPEFSSLTTRKLGEQLSHQPYAPRSPTFPNLDGTNYNFNFSYPPAIGNFSSINATPPTPITHITTSTTPTATNFHYPRTYSIADPVSNLYTLPASPAPLHSQHYSSRPAPPLSPLPPAPISPHPTVQAPGLRSLTHPSQLGVHAQIFSYSNSHEDIVSRPPHTLPTEFPISQISSPPTSTSRLSHVMMSSSAHSGPRGSNQYNKSSSSITPQRPPPPSYAYINNYQKIEIKTKFPVARIKRIMQADEEVGKVAQVTPVAVSKALELFMIALVSGAAEKAREKGSKKVNAQHLKIVVEGQPERFDFLAEIVGRVGEAAGTCGSSDGVASNGMKSMRKRKEDSESASDEEREKEKVKKKGRGRKKKNPD